MTLGFAAESAMPSTAARAAAVFAAQNTAKYLAEHPEEVARRVAADTARVYQTAADAAAALRYEQAKALDPRPVFFNPAQPKMSQAERALSAIKFAQTSHYLDSDALDALKESLTEEQLKPILRQWIRNTFDWGINPKNPFGDYGSYSRFWRATVSAYEPVPEGSLPGTLGETKLRQILKFLGNDEFRAEGDSWESVSDPRYLEHLVDYCLPGVGRVRTLAKDYNGAVRAITADLGLDGVPLSEKLVYQEGTTVNPWYQRKSKNVLSQIEKLVPTITKLAIIAGATVMTGGILTSALGSSALGTTLTTIAKDEVSKALGGAIKLSTPSLDVAGESVAVTAIDLSGEASAPGEVFDEASFYASMSEEQLRAELASVEEATAYRISKGLSAGYQDFTLLELVKKKALIMAALTPILIKKYGLYAAGGLTALLIVKILLRRN